MNSRCWLYGLLLLLICRGGAAPACAQEVPLVQQEFRYWIPDARRVFLVWGINGWNLAPPHLRPPGTTVRDNRLYTPTTKIGGAFAAHLSLPPNTVINFAFLTTEAGDGRAVESWDGSKLHGFQTVASQENVIAFSSWHRAEAIRNSSSRRTWPILLLTAGVVLSVLALVLLHPSAPLTPEAHVLCTLVSLWIVLIAVRTAVLRPANAPLESMLADVPKLLAASCYDFLFVTLLALPFLAIARLARGSQRLERAVPWCCAAASLAFLMLHVANIYVVRAMNRPFYFQWLYYSDFLQSFDARVAIQANLSWRFGLQVLVLSMLLALFARLVAHVMTWDPARRRLGAAGAISALVYVSFSVWYLHTRKLDYRTIANPVLYFGQSILTGRAQPPLFSLQVPEASLEEFQPPSARPGSAIPNQPPRPYNVLLLVLESVPAGMLEAYGGRYPLAPELSRRLPDAMTFSNIYAHSPSTTRAVVSLLGAIHPWISDRMVTSKHPSIDLPTLSSELHQAGYRTGFMSSADNRYLGTDKFLSYRQFDKILDRNTIPCDGVDFRDGFDRAGVDDGCLADSFSEWLAEGRPEQPFFCVLWTFQTHYPYFYAETPVEYEPGDASLNRYLNALHHTDAVLGRVLSALESRNLLDRTLVVVTGDHGEDFRRDVVGHGWSLYEEEVHVPLILINRRLFSGERNSGHADIAPTIMSVLHLPAPEAWQGRSLLDSVPSRRVYLFVSLPDFQFGYREGDLKLLFNASSDQYEVYDLNKDPFETNNLAGEMPGLVQEGQRRLAAWVQYQDRHMKKLLSSAAVKTDRSN